MTVEGRYLIMYFIINKVLIRYFILIKYASKIFRLKVFLGAIDNTDH